MLREWKGDHCGLCGCTHKSWCYSDEGQWLATAGCESRAALQRIWALSPTLAEQMRPGKSGEPLGDGLP